MRIILFSALALLPAGKFQQEAFFILGKKRILVYSLFLK